MVLVPPVEAIPITEAVPLVAVFPLAMDKSWIILPVMVLVPELAATPKMEPVVVFWLALFRFEIILEVTLTVPPPSTKMPCTSCLALTVVETVEMLFAVVVLPIKFPFISAIPVDDDHIPLKFAAYFGSSVSTFIDPIVLL